MPRRDRDQDRTALLGSAGLHGGVVVMLLLSTFFQPEPLVFEAIQVEIVSAADVAEPLPQAPEDLVVETPDPAPADPTPPDPEPDPVVETPPERDPEPEPKPKEPEPKPREPEPKPPEPRPEAPKPTPPQPEPEELTGEDIAVRMEGLRRDYPAYYGNIVRQIERCFRPPPNARGEAVVQFFIDRDGSVSDLEIVRSSGSSALDLEGAAAIDCAGQGRFGPLPDDMPYDRLPVRFRFTPRGQDAPTTLPRTPA